MQDLERYLFDVQGYLVLEDLLDSDAVAELYELLDGHDLWAQDGWRRDENFIAAGAPHTWEAPFRRLIAHPRMRPYLAALCGDGYRYDHGHVICMRKGARSLELHGGGTPFRYDSWYEVRDGRIVNGLVAVAISLVDADVEDGGFVCIPGSHKASFVCPEQLLRLERTGPWLQRVPVRAGSAILFTEALTHGTWPWTAEHERRAVFLKYTPGPLAYSGDYPTPDEAELAVDIEAFSGLLERPYAVSGDGLRAAATRPR